MGRYWTFFILEEKCQHKDDSFSCCIATRHTVDEDSVEL